jgi:hypothetical protein
MVKPPEPLTVTVNVDTPAIQKFVTESMAAAWDRCINDLWDEVVINTWDRNYFLANNPYREDEGT